MNLKWNKDDLPRPFDQKVKFDSLTAVSSAILKYIRNGEYFIKSDLYKNEKVRKYVSDNFIEKSTTMLTTDREWDKFFGQNINVLSRSGLLTFDKSSRTVKFKIKNLHELKKISKSYSNSMDFLLSYIDDFLNDNELKSVFNDFILDASNNRVDKWRNEIKKFVFKNTNINNDKEPTRIFIPMLNYFCYGKGERGLVRGKMISKEIIKSSDLRYNNINFRDKNKDKKISRTDAKIGLTKFEVQNEKRAKDIVRKFNQDHLGDETEFKYNGKLNANNLHIHHIFSKYEYPEFSSFPENMIAIDPNTHYAYAHEGGTQKTNLKSQLSFLRVQIKKVSLCKVNNDNSYSLERMIKLLSRTLYIKFDEPPTLVNLEERFDEFEKMNNL